MRLERLRGARAHILPESRGEGVPRKGEPIRDQPRLRNRRRACDDAIAVIWKALGLDQSLATAKGTSVPVGQLGGGVVERVNNRFGRDRQALWPPWPESDNSLSGIPGTIQWPAAAAHSGPRTGTSLPPRPQDAATALSASCPPASAAETVWRQERLSGLRGMPADSVDDVAECGATAEGEVQVAMVHQEQRCATT